MKHLAESTSHEPHKSGLLHFGLIPPELARPSILDLPTKIILLKIDNNRTGCQLKPKKSI